MLPRNLKLILPLFPIVLAGCGDTDRGAEFSQAVAGQEVHRITNDEEAVDLVLTTESVYMELSDKLLAEVKEGLDEERAEEETSALAGGIKDFVLNGVEKMIQTKIEYDLDEVHEIRWDNGEMIFVVDQGGFLSFDEIEVDDDRPVLETFRRDDALEFIAEFQRVKGQII